jgi:hypothetical protein
VCVCVCVRARTHCVCVCVLARASKALELKHVKACAKKITGSDKPRKLPPAQAKAVNECAKQFMPPTHTKAMLEAAAKKILEANHQKADAASVKKLMSAHSNEVTEAALKGADAKKAAARKRLHAKAAAAHKKVPPLCLPSAPHPTLSIQCLDLSYQHSWTHSLSCRPVPARHRRRLCPERDLTSRLLRSAGLNAHTALFFPRRKHWKLGGAVHHKALGARRRRSPLLQRKGCGRQRGCKRSEGACV